MHVFTILSIILLLAGNLFFSPVLNDVAFGEKTLSMVYQKPLQK